jgi:DNA-directed RNA polymerase subunit M/transcription elongation factor TFIIS
MSSMATADPEDAHASLERVCHICEERVESHVWFARTQTDEEDPAHRVYACPECYFDEPEAERDTYYRERV